VRRVSIRGRLDHTSLIPVIGCARLCTEGNRSSGTIRLEQRGDAWNPIVIGDGEEVRLTSKKVK
jgi:hypothetical protein